MDDKELMVRVQEGDEQAFAELVRNYKDKIVNFLWQMTGDYQKAVELSQETFMRVYFKSDKYRPVAPFSSWIYTIASNLAKTDLKRHKRHKHVSLEDMENRLSIDIPFHENPVNSETIRSLRRALDSLHPRYKIPIILKDIEGFSQEEIALILKKPLGTIKARISRGRDYLRKELENMPFSEETCKEGGESQ
jgi:RNA polymerase sigma-70 factor (ECF subfamily)